MFLTTKYKQLMGKYPERCSLSEEIDLLQFLLDTEQHSEDIYINNRCQYMLQEGYLYYVPN